MTQLHPTKNPLSNEQREQLVALLNENLRDVIDLNLQSKVAHWNVKGPHFLPLHELFDKVFDASGEWIDSLAERLSQLGGVAEANIDQVASKTRLPAYPTSLVKGSEHTEQVATVLSIFSKNIRDAVDTVSEIGDPNTEDLLIEINRGSEEMLWFVESHLI